MAFSIVYITFPNKAEAVRISDQMVDEKRAACANIFPIQSTYWWENAVENGSEVVAILKTTEHLVDDLCARVEQLHSYDVPCLMRWSVSANPAYEAWIRSNVRSEK